MIAMMASGRNTFDDSVNKFNKPMNIGYRISEWFRKEFGSTQCQEITQYDFSSIEGVSTGYRLFPCLSFNQSQTTSSINGMFPIWQWF